MESIGFIKNYFNISVNELFDNKIFFVLFVCFFYAAYNSDHIYLIFNEKKNIKNEEQKVVNIKEETKKKDIKYEDKYIEKLKQNMKDDFEFTKEDYDFAENKYIEFCDNFENNKKKGIIACNDHINRNNNIINEILLDIRDLKYKLENIENSVKLENDFDDCEENSDSDNSSKESESIEDIKNQIEYCEQNIIKSKNIIEEEKNKIIEINNSIIDHDDLKKKGYEFMREDKLKKLKNNIIFENTPLGNVCMRYNYDTSSFEYFSNSTIPFRFLETICRKYVIIYRCTFLYVDLEEELRRCQIKQEEKKKEELILKEEQMKNGNKKEIFAKFKNYNSMPSNFKDNISVPKNRQITNNPNANNNENMILKENTNRYTWKGRFTNFDILKKIDKKLVNKNASLTFSDFKKIINNKKM